MRSFTRLLHLALAQALTLIGALVNAAEGPNFVLVMVDDMTADEVRYLPKTMKYLATEGVQFTNMFVPTGLCGPSRASFLTGNYPQNTGIYTNKAVFKEFYQRGHESNTIASWLHARGYQTALVGKYINGYGSNPVAPPTYLPPGWDRWHAVSQDGGYYNYSLNENGALVTYGSLPNEYSSDVLAIKATDTLTTFLSVDRPFFLLVAPNAPHADDGSTTAVPAPRHAGLFEGLSAPRPSSFNVKDPFRNRPALTEEDIRWIDQSFQLRAQSLQAVDDLVESIIVKLSATGVLGKTHIILTSDNGYYLGEHRIKTGKGNLYEPGSRVPLLFSGPNVRYGTHRRELVSNVDLFPTIADLAFGTIPTNVDGRSLKPLLVSGSRQIADSRGEIKRYQENEAFGLRLPSYRYAEYYRTDGSIKSRELYDVILDPDETRNLFTQVTAASAQDLSRFLGDLRRCAGAECRRLEGEAGDWLVRMTSSSVR